MKKISIIFSFVLMLTSSAEKAAAQFYFYDNNFYDNPVLFELGGSIAAMNCLTDVGGNKGIGKKFVKDLNFGKTHVAGSIYLSAMYKYMYVVRLEATFGKVSADDKVLEKVKETTPRYDRNLNFSSKITDIMLGVEVHPLFIINSKKDDWTPPSFSPYLFGGVGYFSFNPQTKLNGRTVDLQPLSTEGQGFSEYPDRKPYKLNQINLPFGVGVKYELGPYLNFRAEFIYRKINTDYLDDVSTRYIDPTVYYNYFTGAKLTNALLLNDRQYEINPTHTSQPNAIRGYPTSDDSYFTFNIKVGYIFGREKR